MAPEPVSEYYTKMFIQCMRLVHYVLPLSILLVDTSLLTIAHLKLIAAGSPLARSPLFQPSIVVCVSLI